MIRENQTKLKILGVVSNKAAQETTQQDIAGTRKVSLKVLIDNLK